MRQAAKFGILAAVLSLLINFVPPRCAGQGSAASSGEMWGGQLFKSEKHVWIKFPKGGKIKADLAATPVERERGLMFYKTLPKRYCMLFVFPQPAVMEFWMKNTWVPLDIIYVGPERKVTKIYERVKESTAATSDEDVARVTGSGLYVLELPAGASRRLGLRAGSQLSFKVAIPER
jgi:uncharacterized membrane protein (UPF0127 family)